MNLRRLFSIVVSTIFLISCATTHPGIRSKKISSTPNLDLEISADWNADYSDDSNMFLDLTIENKSTSWIHVDQVDVEFPNGENVVHNIIVGNDLTAWAESYAIRKKREEHNAQLGIAGLILAGTVLMVAAVAGSSDGSINKTALAAGAASYAAGATASVSKSINDSRNAAQRGRVVPDTHFLAPMTIPSNGFAQRWMIVNLPQKKVALFMKVRIHTAEGDEGVYEIPLVNNRTRRK